MNISYNWLKEYLPTTVSADELSAILTSVGLEVGGVETVQSVKGGLEGLVVGEVLTCVAHENSDHLHVTTVNVGAAEALQIVCGAPNVATGQKVVVATVGTTLYSGDESFMIKRSKIRGVESLGMICAADEIGLGDDHSGIMVLPADTAVGMAAKDYFGIENDTVLEVDITPNRADAISHYGVARDLAAYFAAAGTPIALNKPSIASFVEGTGAAQTTVEVVDSEACPRYAGLSIRGVKVDESPEWLKNRLKAIGLRPIDNVVDITNYVMHAFGQPLHAFDAQRIVGNKIVVRKAEEGAKFVTLDGVERKLSAQDLMICDAEKPMCIAGVFGGLDSGVTAETTDVFLESAYFNPVSVRQSARRHGLNTDSSFRFERGVDPNGTIFALHYAAMLITEMAGGKVVGSTTDIYPVKIEDFTVPISLQRIHSLIGQELPTDIIEAIFAALEMTIVEKQDEGYLLRVPPYRVDVQRDVDVIEDLLRLYGYNRIAIGESLHSTLSYSTNPDQFEWSNSISDQLTAQGFNEILNNSLTNADYYAKSASFPTENCVKIINALSNELNVMRQTLLFGGLESIAHNVNRQNGDLKFYEFGNCYQYKAEKANAENSLKAYKEEEHLGLWTTGNAVVQSWIRADEPTSIFAMKAYVQNILRRVGAELSQLSIEEFSDDVYSQGLRYLLGGGKVLATIGLVDAKLLKDFEIKVPVFYADIHWPRLMKLAGKRSIHYKEISKFPEVQRDLALLVDKNVTFAQIETLARQTERKLLKSVKLFDVYEGKNLEAGKKSYAVNFVLQDNEKTLVDKQIDGIMQRLIKVFTEQLGAQLR